ncbi:MAG: hypothetical protein NWR72_10740, partial [Bacteroidia bacterium]|nr:hypothetical protein [Bacteroidia bacterium]
MSFWAFSGTVIYFIGDIDMIHKAKFFTGVLFLALLSLWGGIQAQNAPVVQVCQLSDFTQAAFGHSIYLHYLPGAITPRYRWDTNGGIFTIYADSSARVTGRVFNDSLPNWQWDVDLWFVNQKDYATWTALGRDVKIEYAPSALVNANKQNWLFWEFDSTRSRLYGVPSTHFAGDTLLIRHNPPNREFGVQFGVAANAKNGNFGISGWFLFSGSYSGHGDINANAACGPAPCDVVASATATCVTDSTFAATVTFTGSGGPFTISDNKGSTPLVVNTAGTYSYGSYANGDSVTISVADFLAVGCVVSTGSITADCTPPPPTCTVAIDTASAACVTDTTFAITVSFTGAGPYTISDNKGTAPLTGLAGGTYTFGTYASNTVVTIYLTDPSAVACVDSVAG